MGRPVSLGVIDILVSGKPPEHRLPQHSDQSVADQSVAAIRPRVGETFAGQIRKAERVVKFAIGKQPGIGGDDRTAKLERQSAVEIEPERLAIQFTRWVRHDISCNSQAGVTRRGLE